MEENKTLTEYENKKDCLVWSETLQTFVLLENLNEDLKGGIKDNE